MATHVPDGSGDLIAGDPMEASSTRCPELEHVDEAHFMEHLWSVVGDLEGKAGGLGGGGRVRIP